MTNPRGDLTPPPDDDENVGSDDVTGAGPTGETGLPPQLEEMLRGLTGGQVDPQLAEVLKGMGIDQIDPQMLQMAMGQVQSMFAGSGSDDIVDATLATDTARKTVAQESDPVPSERERAAARDAVDVAGLWLDAATDIAGPALRGDAWSGAQWVEATMPVWCRLVEPVAEGVGGAVGAAMTHQLGEGELPPGIVPPGMNPAAMMGQMGEMMQRMHGSLFSVQLGRAVGALAGDVVSGCEVSLPVVPAPTVALMPRAVHELAEGLGIDEPQVRLHLAARETARMRLLAGVPWLAEQLLAAVRDYARDITIDTAGIEEALTSIDPSNPEAVQEALSGKLFAEQHSPAQTAALQRLETWLALVEGWVDVVTDRAVAGHLPQAEALGEAVRRRRATEGPAARTFSALVGLELRPRRLRDAANLFAALESAGGAALRDSPWAHPDLAPGAADLDDPLGYVDRVRSPATDDLDAELDALLRGDGDAGDQ